MQTNFQNRQASLITEAIETIQEQVKLKGSPSFLDIEVKSIPYEGSELWFDNFEAIAEIGIDTVWSEDHNDCQLYSLESDTIMQLADYCLNYKA